VPAQVDFDFCNRCYDRLKKDITVTTAAVTVVGGAMLMGSLGRNSEAPFGPAGNLSLHAVSTLATLERIPSFFCYAVGNVDGTRLLGGLAAAVVACDEVAIIDMGAAHVREACAKEDAVFNAGADTPRPRHPHGTLRRAIVGSIARSNVGTVVRFDRSAEDEVTGDTVTGQSTYFFTAGHEMTVTVHRLRRALGGGPVTQQCLRVLKCGGVTSLATNPHFVVVGTLVGALVCFDRNTLIAARTTAGDTGDDTYDTLPVTASTPFGWRGAKPPTPAIPAGCRTPTPRRRRNCAARAHNCDCAAGNKPVCRSKYQQ